MPKRFVSRSAVVVSASVVLIIACIAIGAQSGLAIAAEARPQPSPGPSPDSLSAEPAGIAVIDSIVANGVKSDSASSSDIELLRAGASVPEATVKVGTELMKGDKISTKDEDQVVLRVSYAEEENDDLVFLDPNSQVAINTVCAVAGRILSWVSSRFRLCTSWGTLGVGGTEFEVTVKPTGALDVLVYEGEVSLDPKDVKVVFANRRGGIGGAIRLGDVKKIPEHTALKIDMVGTDQTVEFSPAEQVEGINHWSAQIIKANQEPGGVMKGYVNYPEDKRVDAFMQARRDALMNDSENGYFVMAQALNDWDNGEAAEKSLSKVKDVALRESPQFMVNEAEAERLQGNLSAATIQLEKTLAKYPDYSPAYYVTAKVFEARVSSDPDNRFNDMVEAKKNLLKALQDGPGKSLINGKAVEADLDKTIKTLGNEALRKGAWLSSGYEWFRPNTTTDWVSYGGTASLNVGGEQISGKAVLSILGDQFKLKTGEKIFTGRIVGNKHRGGISFAMTFDDAEPTDQSQESVVISVIGNKPANGIVLQSVPRQSETFVFTSTQKGPLLSP